MVESLRSTWKHLTAAHPSLNNSEAQRSAELTAGIVLMLTVVTSALVPLFMISDWDYFLEQLGLIILIALVSYAVAYFYSRSPRYEVAIVVIICMIMACIFATQAFLDLSDRIIFGFVLIPLIAAIFFSYRVVAGLSVVSTIAAVILWGTFDNDMLFGAAILAGQGVILMLFISFRNTLENLRRKELEDAVTQAHAATAEAEAAATEANAAREAIEKASAEREALRRDIKELSSPTIPLMEGVLLMPLIGTLDSHRAQDMMRALLAGITKHRTRIVLLDITGVPVMDSAVAQYLNQSIMAARLKGTRCIITGMSNAVAETVVDLGIDWGTVETMRDLQSGLMIAMQEQDGRSIN